MSSHRTDSIAYSSSATDPTATANMPSNQPSTSDDHGRRTSLSARSPASQHPARDVSEPVNPATDSAPLKAHHRPSIQGDGHQGLEGDTTIRRASLSQNAPGKAGEVGEAAVGALGFGGSAVERPKENRGLGEKIVAFLGT
ncbi:uncharacterized protein HMPREF1541_10096 [Cyphellophora europaea CBS 101466]|uniref:Uncharacterized protein n=1 Tax=Cyphellophora europaea (strain CBS 101466) TaxID=1220924 RepID=W2SBC0_CYPE1|nr:uncharacterized protein HMPREF1541_10096 [Cyphellophora europaea CBS 101466]ETN45219.1 hypothetical protein HMPREF1541_10096 [Cyphellophora europaea CBS 101466]